MSVILRELFFLRDFVTKRTEWRTSVTASAHRQRQEMSWKSPKLLPLTEDCVKFNNYLHRRELEIKSECSTDGDLPEDTYKALASTTLAQIVVFNRRRPQEVETIKVEDYKAQVKSKKPIQDEIMQSLTMQEKLSLQGVRLIVVRGKRGRGVPILLPPNLKDSTDLLAKHNEGKEFLFARVGDTSSTPLRAYQVVAELADAAVPKLKYPKTIRCTKLRKHLATLSKLLDLKNELEQLANHMGHDISTHREYYCLPQETILLAKMSKLLNLASMGKLHQFKGKSLEDVALSSEDIIPDEVEEDEEDGLREKEHEADVQDTDEDEKTWSD
ncbi:hypothetical protein HOLleu_01514 [Holothuria leucospilota]|uniref:Uncharacterized protein n=1 Tax=Holothuria leucospilota TaxID=206669 RepID=A0A9Q1CQ24_HOLLE|nr:hypothetical protein HOLleu_01514 [Holothuria leucospilota]